MPAGGSPSAVFVMPPGGVVPYFAEHLGTAFLRTMLAREGIPSAQYLPRRNVPLPAFARFLSEHRPAVVGLTAYESNLRGCRAMARAVRERLPEALVIVGGPNATFSPEETLELVGADACLRGAGEGTIVRIVQAMLGAEGPRRPAELLADVPNLVVRAADGSRRTRAGDLSSFPGEHFGCLDDIPSPYQAGLLETADVGLLTARGCNQHCTYCSFAEISGRRIHTHGVERVLEDAAALEALVHRTERRRLAISVLDDAFTLSPRRARAICEGLIRRGLRMPLDCETRADRVDAELLRLMRRAGFVSVSFGLESAVPRVLRAMGKVRDPATRDDPAFEAERDFLERLRRAVGWAQEAGLAAAVSVIGGFPGETADDFRATLAFVESLGVPWYAHNVLSALPGTPVYRERERHGLRVEREAGSGAWRTYHAYDVESVRPLESSSRHRALWEEASEIADAICGRPRPARASDDAAWAAVLHLGEADRSVAAWLREVLAVSGAVVVVNGSGPPDAASWLRVLNEEEVPWGGFTLLAPERTASDGSRVLRSLGTLGEHRFEVSPTWPAEVREVDVDEAGNCRVPVWFAADAPAPPAGRAGVFAPSPQIADGCRWWSAWRRCRRPRVLHVWPGGTVTPCWRGPAIGAVGDAYRVLAARGEALGGGQAASGPGACPLRREGEGGARVSAAAEAREVAAQAAWHFRRVASARAEPVTERRRASAGAQHRGRGAAPEDETAPGARPRRNSAVPGGEPRL